jgi:DNA-binding response OmpR family regulator
MSQAKKFCADLRILIAEDDKFISRALKDGLSRAGFHVANAYNGEEALQMIKNDSFDILLLDLIMPVKDGLEVLREVKADKKYQDMPVLIFTNLESDETVRKAKELGAEEYLTKADFTIRDIIAKIKEYCDTRKQMNVLYKI